MITTAEELLARSKALPAPADEVCTCGHTSVDHDGECAVCPCSAFQPNDGRAPVYPEEAR